MIEEAGKSYFSAKEIAEDLRISEEAVNRRAEKLKIQAVRKPAINVKNKTVNYYTWEQREKIRTMGFTKGCHDRKQYWKLSVKLDGRMIVKCVSLTTADAVDLKQTYDALGIETKITTQ